jgi:hypothetical protein
MPLPQRSLVPFARLSSQRVSAFPHEILDEYLHLNATHSLARCLLCRGSNYRAFGTVLAPRGSSMRECLGS